MNKQIALSLRSRYSTDPLQVDRILVSAFITKNRITVQKNVFLRNYIIRPNDEAEFLVLKWFLELLKKYKIALTIEDLIELFEFVISPEDKVITGAVYTPAKVRKYIINHTVKGEKAQTMQIADISCGCGGFLYDAARKIHKLTKATYAHIFSKQLYGLDIQPFSVIRTQLLLSLLAVHAGEDIDSFTFNIQCGNALSFDWKQVLPQFTGFDVIVGNPPYVCARNIDPVSKGLLSKWKVSNSGHPDLYIPFFQIALENLHTNGTVGYITMNTFFKSVNGRALRTYFQEHTYRFNLIDFNTLQLFKSRSTYTCICLITKHTSPHIGYYKCESLSELEGTIAYIPLDYSLLDAWKGWNLNVEQEIITHIENVGTPFHKKYKTRNGFATLKNNVYIFTPENENKQYYYLRDENEDLFPIEKKICREAVNPNLLINVQKLSSIKEKIIFPYVYKNNKTVVIEEGIFKAKYPMAYKYLVSKKNILAERDKGKGINYNPWYMYGRSQSLEPLKHKLFFPHITPQTPNYLINSDPNLLFYNGLAVIGKSRDELIILQKLLSSRLFWFYIRHTSKPYGSQYFSLSKNYIKDFGIYEFTTEDRIEIRNENDPQKLDAFFEKKYKVKLRNQ